MTFPSSHNIFFLFLLTRISPGVAKNPKLFARPLFFGGLLDGSGFANLELQLRETPYGLELFHPDSDWVAVIPPMRRSVPPPLDDIENAIVNTMSLNNPANDGCVPFSLSPLS